MSKAQCNALFFISILFLFYFFIKFISTVYIYNYQHIRLFIKINIINFEKGRKSTFTNIFLANHSFVKLRDSIKEYFLLKYNITMKNLIEKALSTKAGRNSASLAAFVVTVAGGGNPWGGE